MKKFTLLMAVLLPLMAANAQNTSLPITLSFDTQEAFDAWTVVNANGGVTWVWNESEKAATCDSPKGEAADDWLISPAIELEAGKAYEIMVYVKSSLSIDVQKFSITAGLGTTIEEHNTEIFSETYLKSTNYNNLGDAFSPETTGTYHIGIHCYSGSWNGTFFLQKLEIKAAPIYPAQIQDLTVTPGENGALEAKLQWTWPDKNHLGSALEDLTGGKIYRKASSSYTYTEIADLTGAAVGSAATYTDNTLTQSGVYSYRIVAYNTSGEAQGTAQTVTSTWIGEDIPNPVDNLTATADKNVVTLNFTPPTGGQNGGWLDPAALRYNIIRNAGSTSTTLEEAYEGELPYIDTVDELNAYTYTVRPVNTQGDKGYSNTTNEVIAGNAKSIPYSAPLSTAAEIKLFTIIDGNDDGYKWQFSSYSKRMNYFNGQEADEWFITPAISMEAGQAYKLTFQTGLENASNAENYKNLAVTIGRGNTAEAQATVCYDELIQSALMESKEVMFTVPENGEWNVGFHCHGQTNSRSIYLKSIQIEEAVFVPKAAGNLAVAPGEAGALTATITWTNPSQTTAETKLTAIEKTEIYRGNELIHTDEASVTGTDGTYTDTGIAEAGTYTYKVKTYALGQTNETAVTSPWIGEDTPNAVNNLSVAATDDLVTITFGAPEGGVHNGWVDTDALRYRIVRNPGETVVSEGYALGEPFVDIVPGLGVYTYTVTPVSATGTEGTSATSESIAAGNAIEPPYIETFETNNALSLFTIVNANNDSRTWNHSSYNKVLEYWGGTTADDYIFTPKVKLYAGYTYSFSVDTWLEKAINESYHKTLELTLGNDVTAEAHTAFAEKLVQSTFRENFASEFTVPESGVWYLGIHVTGATNSYSVYINNLKIDVISDGGEATGMTTAEAGGLTLWCNNGTLHILAPEARTAWLHTIDGRTIRSIELNEGENKVDGLPAGVYLIDRQIIILTDF